MWPEGGTWQAAGARGDGRRREVKEVALEVGRGRGTRGRERKRHRRDEEGGGGGRRWRRARGGWIGGEGEDEEGEGRELEEEEGQVRKDRGRRDTGWFSPSGEVQIFFASKSKISKITLFSL
jgi:hypothetical protein